MLPPRGSAIVTAAVVVAWTSYLPLQLPAANELPKAAAHEVDFHREVLPVLARRCITCHANGRNENSFSIENRAALLRGGDSGETVVVGKSSESLLIQLVAGHDPDRVMPQQGKRLTDKEIGVLRAWIDQGAKWDEDVSLTKLTLRTWQPREVALPSGGDGGATNPIDRLLAKHWSDQEESPLLASDRIWVRRVYLDTIGLLPTVDEVAAFVADQRPDKHARLVKQLLGDQHAYAQHWLSFWNDLLRNDYQGTGFIDGGRKQITGWLYQSLVDNKPFDQFARELVAGAPGAEGFTKGIVWRGRVNASQRPPLQAAQTTAQVFLGLNLKCASCHDSFVSQWTLDDAYGLAAVFSDQPLEVFRCDKPTGRIATPAFFNSEIGEVELGGNRQARQQKLAELLTGAQNRRLARTIVNRLWQRLMGRAIIEPVDEMDAEPWNEDLFDWLANDLHENGYDLKRTMQLVLTSQQYQFAAVPLSAEDRTQPFAYRGPVVKRMTAEQFLDSIWQVTGTGTGPGKGAAKVGPVSAEQRPGFARAAQLTSDALMRSLGRPNREQVVTTRPDQLTTLQALDLTNGNILASTLDRAADNLLKQHADWNYDQAMRHVYLLALSREPTHAELKLMGEFVEGKPTREDLSDLYWMVFMLPEFQLMR